MFCGSPYVFYFRVNSSLQAAGAGLKLYRLSPAACTILISITIHLIISVSGFLQMRVLFLDFLELTL